MAYYCDDFAANTVFFLLFEYSVLCDRLSPPVRGPSWTALRKYINTESLYGTKQNDGWAVRQQPINEQIGCGKWKEKEYETKVNKDGNAKYVGHPARSELSLRHAPR